MMPLSELFTMRRENEYYNEILFLSILADSELVPGVLLSHFEETTLKAIIKNESCQICYSHIPHGSAGGDDENEKILSLQFDILDNQRQFNSCEEENDAKN